MMSAVEVTLDPDTAFEVFTREIDYWWLRGPINNWDAARVIEMRCEEGVGGRLLEIYGEGAEDHLELARITAWEPGRRLAWDSSVDDVRIEVLFEATANGTRVELTATIPPAGRDAGGTSFIRVTPGWFGSWCAARDRAPRAVRETARLAVAVYYPDPGAAARWLRDVFGLRPELELPADDNVGGWIELRVGNAALMVFKGPSSPGHPEAPTHVPWLFVDDLDAHFEHARSGGATIVEPIHQHGYRAYVAEDPYGHHWTFAQARPTQTS